MRERIIELHDGERVVVGLDCDGGGREVGRRREPAVLGQQVVDLAAHLARSFAARFPGGDVGRDDSVI